MTDFGVDKIVTIAFRYLFWRVFIVAAGACLSIKVFIDAILLNIKCKRVHSDKFDLHIFATKSVSE